MGIPTIFRRVCKIAKSYYSPRHVRPSVRPSVLMEQLGSHSTDFHEIWYLRIFRKSDEKIQVSIKSDKNNLYFTWRPIYIFYRISIKFFLEWQIFQTKVVEEIKTHFVFSNFFPLKNPAFYDIMWKNTVKWGRPQMTIWRMHIACWIPTATNRQTGCVIFIVFPLQQWLHERNSMWRFMYFACLVTNKAWPHVHVQM
jgi:hypothetical protein